LKLAETAVATTISFDRDHKAIMSTSMSHSQSSVDLRSAGWNGLNEKRYVPSHLTHMSFRNYTPERASPLSPTLNARRSSNSFASSSNAPGAGSGNVLNASTSRFGGPSFGTPKSNKTRSKAISDEDVPPSLSIYDSPGGISSPFSQTPSTKENVSGSPPSSSYFGARSGSNSSLDAASEGTRFLDRKRTAVRIFGFPSEITDLVLKVFSKYGNIHQHSTSEGAERRIMGGNWLQITYSDPESAARAVAANGTVVGGAYMVGCVHAPSNDDMQSDAMDMETLPPSVQQLKRLPRTTSAPALSQSTLQPHQSAATNGRRVQVLGGEGIFAEKPKTSGWFAWLFGESTTDHGFQTQQQSGRLRRIISEFIFGF